MRVALIVLAIAALWLQCAGSAQSAAKKSSGKTAAKSTKSARAKSTKQAPKSAKKPAKAPATKPAPSNAAPSTAAKGPAVPKEAASDTAAPEAGKTASPGAYTSLIVDATGLKLTKSMSPKVLRADGSCVWGKFAKLTDEQYDVIQDRGMVAYTTTVEEAKSNSRAGANPLVVKAVASSGQGCVCDLVVADEDAERIIAGNDKCGYLDRFDVVFVRNETPVTPTPPAAEQPAAEQPCSEAQDGQQADQ